MALNLKPSQPSPPEHRAEMIKIAQQVNAEAGIPIGPPMTRDEANEAVLELQRYQVEVLGIRPEENGASRELLRMRYGDEYNPDEDE